MEKDQKTGVLAVDDRPENLLAVRTLLEGLDINLVEASSGQEALALILEHDFALVLLDVQMPEMDGFETAELMRGNEKTAYIPIIFITAISKDQKYVFKGYDSGAVDYLFKPLEPEVLRSKVKIFLELYQQRMALENTTAALKRANQQILDQQKSVIEEERLKVLLQMAGATAHELNQPLTSLLGLTELLRTDEDEPDKMAEHVERITEAGKQIDVALKKIHTIHRIDHRAHGEISIPTLDQNIRLLHVEDSNQDFERIHSVVKNYRRIHLSRARSLEEGMERLHLEPYDLIILDYLLPDGNGLDWLTKIEKEGFEIPVVFVTGKGDEVIASQAIQAGAYDYLPKHLVNEASLSRTITNALEKFRLSNEIVQARKRIAEMSTTDELTGLYNRRYMNEIFQQEFSRAKRYQTDLSCLMIDLDFFKKINDSLGHVFGDFVLKEFAKCLNNQTRDSDLCFRYGGEEF